MRYFSILLPFVFLCWSVPAHAVPGDDGLSPAREYEPGQIEGCVIDATTGERLPGAAVRIRGIGLGQATDAEGCFHFENLRPNSYTLLVQFLGYEPKEQRVVVEEGEQVETAFALNPSALDLPDVVVTGTGRERSASDAYRPTSVVTAQELHRRLDVNVPSTLTRVPGFSAQYNAPGATRPVIRGMGGDRVLMLEDGQRTGDLYQTASDHGVMVEPVTAERIEVLRGPAGLLYGSSALGGVVNVIRNDIPLSQPSRLTGTFTSQLESVNQGAGGGGMLLAPVGPFTVRGEASARRAADTRTPEGTLPSSDIQVVNLSLGGSWTPGRGAVGAAYRFYDNVYGVPGEFNGRLIPGAHPGGVDIEARRHVGRIRAVFQPELGLIENVEFDANLTRYLHNEIELRREDRPDVYGARFDQATGEASLMAHHQHDNAGVRLEGAVGVSASGRALRTGGSSPGSRSANEQSAAAFLYEEFRLAPIRLQAGVRFDYHTMEPLNTNPIRVRTQERTITKPVTERSFGAFSGSLATLYDVSAYWTVGVSLSRSFRNPTIEELYSDGPHLADFSFDIGSPDLDAEFGTGLDVFARASRPHLSLEVAGFFNRMTNYIYYRPTGESIRTYRRDEEGSVVQVQIPVFEAQGDDADFLGAEARVQWEALPKLVIDGTASYVRATRRSEDDPLPAIPPLNGSLELRYETDALFGSVAFDGATAQRRVPSRIERDGQMVWPDPPTDRYGLLNAGIGYRLSSDRWLHTVSLDVKNLTDAVWRDHLSRIREVAPQPGRNIRLTYRVQF